MDPGGKPVQPEGGEQYELGLKAEAFGGRLSALVAAYHADRTNVAVPDPINPIFFDVIGEQRDRGVDFDGNFTPVRGWDGAASYAFIDARVTAGLPDRIGTRPRGVAEHTWSLWTKYTVQDGLFHGLGAGLGYRYLTKQEGDAANSFTLPSYGLLDLALYYTHERFHGQMNVSNATNERYFSGSFSQLQVNPGYPIRVSSSVAWGF